MTYRTYIKWIPRTLLLLAVSTCAVAQMPIHSDPWGDSSNSGATGLQPSNSPADAERVGSGDQGKLIQFKAHTTLVQVPVVVTDAAGKHIQGLTKADFRILENGKPQTIDGFQEIVPSTSVLAPSTSPAGTFTNVTPDESQPRSLTVIVLDEVNTPFLSQAYARGQLIKYLANHLDATQPLGLMVIDRKGLTELSGLDADPAQLIAILKKASGKVSEMERFSGDAQAAASVGSQPSSVLGGIRPGDSPEAKIRGFILQQDAINAADTQARAIETTLRAFLSLAWSLSGVPGRKSLVWVTGSFPFTLDSFAAVPGDANTRALYERTLKSLNDAQISVYPLDARGLTTDPKYSADTEGSMLSPQAPDALRQASLNSLKNFAEMTGGIAYYNTNDLAGAFGRAVQDSSSYYLLSYYLDHHDNKPGWRKLQVVVARKDAEVRARAGYLVTEVAVNPERTHKADVEFALISPFESTGIPITEQWQGVQADGSKKKIGFVLQVPAAGLIDEADKNRIDVEIVAQATSKGVNASTLSQTMKGAIVPETLAKLKADGIVYRNFLDLAPGDYQVRFVVRDNQSGKIGSVIVPLTVN
ncbi:MAG: VWA domain-containing protein [Candidatus Korobacteraceae bacterium]